MKKIIFTLSVMVLCSLAPQMLRAQWKVSVNAGAVFNKFSIDKQYMTDYRFNGAWGASMGVMTQYNFTDWFGVRAALNFVQRNYQHTRAQRADWLDCKYQNDYLLLPVTANFSFGGKTLKGFLDLGVYGGGWINSHRSGKEYSSIGQTSYEFSEDVAFNTEKDQRLDFGYAAGVGMEWQFVSHWAVQAEALCYYSVVSTVKQYMTHVKDYRYNTTAGLQASIIYLF